MGSAVVSLMVFLGIILILRGVVFGIIPYLAEKKKKDLSHKKEKPLTKEKD
jgi:hypothetical protein